jgi:hypothetical protein
MFLRHYALTVEDERVGEFMSHLLRHNYYINGLTTILFKLQFQPLFYLNYSSNNYFTKMTVSTIILFYCPTTILLKFTAPTAVFFKFWIHKHSILIAVLNPNLL